MTFQLTDKDGTVIGSGFVSVDTVKRLVPQVVEWRPDESRPMGWNGWLADPGADQPAAFARPDYLITFVPGPHDSRDRPALHA
jgi:hypothetical protein